MMKSIWNMVVRYFRQTDKVIWGLCLTASAMSVVLLLGIWNSGMSISPGPSSSASPSGSAAGRCSSSPSGLPDDGRPVAAACTADLRAGAAHLYPRCRPGGRYGLARDPVHRAHLQPSELLKLSFIITFASHLQKVEGSLNQPEVLVPVLCHMALPTVLIMLQGDDGSALIFLCIGCGMLFAAGIGWKYILAAGERRWRRCR